jgi:hypothetical protein
MGENKNTYNILVGNLKVGNSVEDIGVDGRLILI